MPRGIASAKQLAVMQSVLDSYCVTHGIVDPGSREELSALILQLFDRGARSADDLSTALDNLAGAVRKSAGARLFI